MRRTKGASLEDGIGDLPNLLGSKYFKRKLLHFVFLLAQKSTLPFSTMAYINNVKSMFKNPLCIKKLSSIKIRTQVEALLNGNHSTNVSTVISKLVNLTRPGIELRLDTQELSTSLDVLVILVTLNSELNSSVINTSADQQNIIQVASNLLEEVNSNTWLQLQKVLPFYCCYKSFIKHLFKTSVLVPEAQSRP